MAQDPSAKIKKDLAIIKCMVRINIVVVAVLMVEVFAFGRL
jgi:hypothetical protein